MVSLLVRMIVGNVGMYRLEEQRGSYRYKHASFLASTTLLSRRTTKVAVSIMYHSGAYSVKIAYSHAHWLLKHRNVILILYLMRNIPQQFSTDGWKAARSALGFERYH
jgi:hypothetical protein